MGQSLGGYDLDAAAQPCLLNPFGRQDDTADPPPGQGGHHWQGAGNWPQLTAKRQFSENGPPAGRADLLRSDEDSERNREIERRPALAQLGRGEIHGYPPGRVLVAAVADGAPDPFTGFLQGGVGQADDRESRQSGSDVHLDTDKAAVEAVQSGREK